MRKKKLTDEEAEKHWELYKHITNSVGPENVLSFITNSLLSYFIQVKNKDTGKYLTKKEIIDLIIEIMKYIAKRINELKDLE